MSFNNHHHHHHQERPYVEEQCFEGERIYGPPSEGVYERVDSSYYEASPGGGRRHNHHQRDERLGELGAVAAGAFALYEANKAKTDPSHAHKHKREEEIAGLGALGSAGYGYYEHREKEKFEDGRRW